MQAETTTYLDCQYAGDYKVHFLLGQGGQANVYLGSRNNNLYALKVYLPGANKEDAFKREVEFLENLKFPHLINLVDSKINAQVKLKNSEPEARALIVLEFAEGQLFDFISKEGRFSQQVTRTLFKQLLSSIKFLDDRGITHRDLKPQNILFDKDFNFKVSDFGLSTFSEGHDKDGVLYSRVGTEGYKPPEMQQGKYTGIQADIFAAGVILFIMYNGTPPFLSTKPHDRIYKLIKDKNFAKFWALHQKKKPVDFYPNSFKRLLNEFFSYQPNQRPTFNSLNQDEWLNGQAADKNQLKIYMSKRYEKIASNDQVKKKVALVRKQMFMNEIMLDEKDEKSSNTRSAQSSEFITLYKQRKNLKIQELPLAQSKVVLINSQPSFVLAWINDYLRDSLNKKQTFLQGYMQEITPQSFDLTIQKNLMQLKFKFEIDEQEEETLVLKGSLCQKDGKVGVEWKRQQGNDFWLSSIEKNLNEMLQAIV